MAEAKKIITEEEKTISTFIDSKRLTCECCNKYSTYHLTEINDKYYCISCVKTFFWYCDECKKFHSKEIKSFRFNRNSICKESVEKLKLYICTRCNSVVNSLNNYREGICCSRDLNESRFTPMLNYYGCSIEDSIDGSVRTFGFENEVYGDIDSRFKLSNYKEFVYLKYDGSLNSGGYEIVSHPMTLKFMKTNKEMNEVFEIVQKNCKSFTYNSTGLHIHVNKSCLNNLDVIKLIYFFKNWNLNRLLEKLAQREFLYHRYCYKYIDSKGTFSISSKEISNIAFGKNNNFQNNRYACINFKNKNTIEFRFFKGNENKNAVITAIEIVDLILNFIQSEPLTFFVSENKDAEEKFTKYCIQNGSEEIRKRIDF